METILTVKDLTIAFGTEHHLIPAVQDLNFELIAGQCLGVVGESGSGKSLTALSIMQLLPPTALLSKHSEIIFEGEDLLDFSERHMRAIRGKKIGMIFQDAMSALNPVLTIGQQFKEITSLSQAARTLKEVGIDDVKRCLRSYPHELSGGMRQRAMIGLAICNEPDILIADEPTTALDVTIQAQILHLLKELKEKKNKTILFIGHDLSVVSQLADRIMVMHQGKKVEEQDAKIFFQKAEDPYSKKLLAAILPTESRQIDVPSAPAILRVDDLKVYFPIRSSFLKRTIGYVKAVDDINFTVPQGQTFALVGESGSGKTTTAKAIVQLIKPIAGSIHYKDHSLIDAHGKEMRIVRSDVQFIFQDPYSSLDPRMMVLECIAEGLKVQNPKMPAAEIETKVDDILTQVQLPTEAKWRYPHEFSGGQRQRIAIARALILEPKLLILDEPTSALDASIQKQIIILLDRLQKELNLSYLLITHNLSVVAYLAHQMAVMHHGKIVEQGYTADILRNPAHSYTQKLLHSIPMLLRDSNNGKEVPSPMSTWGEGD